MSETFFESPLYVYIALGLAELVLAAIWYERRNRHWALAMVVPPVLVVAVALVAHWVVTDREKIILAAGDIARAAEAGRLERIPPHLDEAFSSAAAGMDLRKSGVVDALEARIRRWRISAIRFNKMRVEIDDGRARMHVTTVISYGRNGDGRAFLIWDVLWAKRGDTWRILEVQSVRQGIEL